MTPTQFLTTLKSEKQYANQIVHLEHLGSRAAKFARLDEPLFPHNTQRKERIARAIGFVGDP